MSSTGTLACAVCGASDTELYSPDGQRWTCGTHTKIANPAPPASGPPVGWGDDKADEANADLDEIAPLDVCGNCGKPSTNLVAAWWDDGALWCPECVGPDGEKAYL